MPLPEPLRGVRILPPADVRAASSLSSLPAHGLLEISAGRRSCQTFPEKGKAFYLKRKYLKDFKVFIKRIIACCWHGMTPSHRELQKHDGKPFSEVDQSHLSALLGLPCSGGKERYVRELKQHVRGRGWVVTLGRLSLSSVIVQHLHKSDRNHRAHTKPQGNLIQRWRKVSHSLVVQPVTC